jgi:hypothetical protein
MSATTDETAPVETVEQAPITEQIPVAENIPATGADAVDKSGVDGGPDESSGIDEGLAELARSYGINPERWQDADALQGAISQIDRAYAHHLAQAQQQFQVKPQGQPVPPAAPPQPTTRQKPNWKELLPEAEYDETIRKAMATIYDDLASQLSERDARLAAYEKHGEKLQELETFKQQLSQREAEREAVQLESRLDGYFDKLGKEWEDVFGKGAMRALSPRSVQAANRNSYVAALKQIEFIDSANGIASNPAQQERRALHMAFGDQLPTIERRKLALQANQRRNGALSRPAAKNGKPLDAERKILSEIGEWAAKQAG